MNRLSASIRVRDVLAAVGWRFSYTQQRSILFSPISLQFDRNGKSISSLKARPIESTSQTNKHNNHSFCRKIIIGTSQQPDKNPEPSLRSSDTPTHKMPVTGGLGEVFDKDDEITNVVDKIKPVLEEKSGLKFETIEVVNYRTQVVAGRNYFVKVSTCQLSSLI